MLIGYARVSTTDQNTELQKRALIRAECELIFEDTASGKNAQLPGLKKAIRRLRRGDTLMVWKLDRLGRSVRDLIELVSALRRFFFHVMSALAEMERELIVERTRAGLDTARLQGRISGRKRLMTQDVLCRAEAMLATGATRLQVTNVVGVSEKTIYKYFPARSKDGVPDAG
ncbi:DNA-invertase [Pectobacterium parvum]|uniref:recombinase family protein n=1 Tax=Pectobacterium parvum TaxID=2778550 RepID=UPI000508A875|nr:recombinase family protein [Pectobacterium parvum]KFX18562.1 DNA-invertase [Pectobacterium parvum]